MAKRELMTKEDIHAFGVEIVYKQLEKDGWRISSVDVEGDLRTQPQIVADKDGELAFFVIRTDIHPGRSRSSRMHHGSSHV
jgi:hypothetical protein